MPLFAPATEFAELPFVPCLLGRLAPEFGARVFVDTAYKHFGFVEFDAAPRLYFKGTAFGLNGQASGLLSKDKHHTASLLSYFGFRTPTSVLVHSPHARQAAIEKQRPFADRLTFAEPALGFIARHGLPVFVKPNDGTGGADITKAQSVEDVFTSLAAIFETADQALIQTPVAGRDFRIVIVDGEVTAVYERLPPIVTGDGRRTLGQLLADRDQQPGTQSGPKTFPQSELARVPDAGAEIEVLDVASLSRGGRCIDRTDVSGSDLSAMAAAATRALGLRFAGLDVLAPNPECLGADATILEVNSAPSLERFAAAAAHLARAEATYRRLLQQAADGA